MRGREGGWDTYNKGVADLRLAADAGGGGSPVHYTYNIRSVTLDTAGGHPRIQVGEFVINMRLPLSHPGGKVTHEEVGFKNPVSLRDGERVVVGTTSVADKNLVVILSAGTVK